MQRPLLAVRTKNCAKFIRVSYYFDFPIDRLSLGQFSDFQLEINEFSKFVSTAKDHFKLARFEPAVLISGVLGEKCFDVAFGKFSKTEEDQEKVIREFQEFLLSQGFGDYVHAYDRNSPKSLGS